LVVQAVNYPLAYFVRRIGGSAVRVSLPVPAGEDPAFWVPTADDVAVLQSADLIVLNGAGYEPWLATVSLPSTRIIDTTAGVIDQLITIDETVTHQHGPTGEHAHAVTAFTTWLDPTLAMTQADAIRDALIAARPDQASALTANAAALTADLDSLDARVFELTHHLENAPILFSHPIYQYFQRRYGLNGLSVHWEPGETPTVEQWHEFDVLLRQHPASVMLWESEPSPETVTELSSRGITVSIFDPAATPPATPPADVDYLIRQQANADDLEDALTNLRATSL
jgi:zinc transport system substrate-binding protein